MEGSLVLPTCPQAIKEIKNSNAPILFTNVSCSKVLVHQSMINLAILELWQKCDPKCNPHCRLDQIIDFIGVSLGGNIGQNLLHGSPIFLCINQKRQAEHRHMELQMLEICAELKVLE